MRHKFLLRHTLRKIPLPIGENAYHENETHLEWHLKMHGTARTHSGFSSASESKSTMPSWWSSSSSFSNSDSSSDPFSNGLCPDPSEEPRRDSNSNGF